MLGGRTWERCPYLHQFVSWNAVQMQRRAVGVHAGPGANLQDKEAIKVSTATPFSCLQKRAGRTLT